MLCERINHDPATYQCDSENTYLQLQHQLSMDCYDLVGRLSIAERRVRKRGVLPLEPNASKHRVTCTLPYHRIDIISNIPIGIVRNLHALLKSI
jgi:hypothetical protein